MANHLIPSDPANSGSHLSGRWPTNEVVGRLFYWAIDDSGDEGF